MSRVRVIDADITRLPVDAIVNAANASLLGGGGVDGAIHRAAGPRLTEACRQLGGCATGQAKITPGFDLPARYVIHTVGPVWRGGQFGEGELLASCHHEALRLAREYALRTVAFPAISCGAYGFPIERAASIAVATVLSDLSSDMDIESVCFACFGGTTLRAFRAALGNREAHCSPLGVGR